MPREFNSSFGGFRVPIIFSPWGRWTPYYGYGYGGYNAYGFACYDPWGSYYGGTRWRWSGPGYGSGCWDPYYYPYGMYGGVPYASSRGYDRDEPDTIGSIRLKAKPASARVYIDGALVGTVDDFDGLSNHLSLEGGLHQIEIRADGYETYTGEITVEVGKTMTERISLKKKT